MPPVAEFPLPAADPAGLQTDPCVRFGSFLPDDAARGLRAEVVEGLEYERVEIGAVTRQWRARRPTGDGYFGPMVRRSGWVTPPSVSAALGLFESVAFVEWLSALVGSRLRFLRPPTAYRLGRGDRICLHDDMSDPDHAVSVAYNLSIDWDPEWGGITRFGDVESVTPIETPPDSPIDLQEWRVRNERRFIPEFNSLLVMRLGFDFAHGVDEVVGEASRHALVGIYGYADDGGNGEGAR